MAQQPAPSNLSSVTVRVISAGVMLPVVLAAVWFGGWVFTALAGLVAGLSYWEWQGMCGERGARANLAAAGAAAGPALLYGTDAGLALAVTFGAAVAAGLLKGPGHRLFLAGGFAYIVLACIGLVWLRLEPGGAQTIVWLGAAVVMTDTCAYFSGRTIGGPRLAPKISPKKTWAGLIGGIIGAALAGAVVAILFSANILTVTLVSGILAVVAQIGDLAVSKAKRSFGVKDSSNIIPGHGGVLDRFDGVLATACFVAALSIAGGGAPLSWL